MPNYNLGSIEGDIKIRYDSSGIDKATKHTDEYTKKTSDAGAAVKDLSGKAVAGGAVIAGGLGLAVKAAADFEKTLSGVKAVSGATTQEMEKLRAKAMQIGQDTSFSSSQAAMAMEELVKAGIKVTDVLDGAADATVALAAAGGVELPVAAEIASAAMNNFSLAAKDLPHVADLIAGAANASAIDVGDFGESLKQAGASASLVGLRFDDLAVAITAMGNAGIKGSDAGTSLKTFLSNLQPSTKEQIKLFDKLGITTKGMGNQFFDSKGKVKSMADIAGVLEKALKGMTEQQKAATLETLFGSDAIRAAAIIAKEGKAGIEGLTKELGKISAADVAKTRMDNFAGTMENLKGTLENAAISIGQVLIPVLRDFAGWLNKLVGWFNNLPGPVKTVITQFLAISALTLLLVGGFTKLALGIAGTVKQVFTLLGWCDKLLGAFMGIDGKGSKAILNAAKNFAIAAGQMIANAAKMVASMVATVARVVAGWVIMATQALVQAARMAAAWLIALGPIPLIIAAIIALVTIIILNWDKVVKFLTDTWNWISNLAQSVWGAIVSWFTNTWNSFVSWLTGIWNGIMTFLSDTWNMIGALAESTWTSILNFLKGIWDTLVQAVSDAVSAIINFFVNLWNNISSAVATFASNVWNGIKNGVSNAYNAVVEWLGKVIQWFKDLPGNILKALGNIGSALWEAGKALVNGFWEGIKSIWNKMVSWVENGMEWLRGLWPFSPAQWGPFSGKGYVTHSGEAMTSDFAASILAGLGDVRGAAERLMGAAQGAVATPVMIPELGAFSVSPAANPTTPVTETSGHSTIEIANLTLQVTGNLDPTRPVEWRNAMLEIREGIRSVEKENA